MTADRTRAPSLRHTGPSLGDPRKARTKHYLITDRTGIPLVTLVSGANRHESAVFEALVDTFLTRDLLRAEQAANGGIVGT